MPRSKATWTRQMKRPPKGRPAGTPATGSLSSSFTDVTAAFNGAVTSTASAVTLSGSSSGFVNNPTTFTVTLNGAITNSVIVTPAASGLAGTIFPTSITFLPGGGTVATFTFTPTAVGTGSVSITNNGGLSNLGTPITFTSSTLTSTLSSSFRLTSGTSLASAPFTIGHGFKKGEVPSGQGVVVTGANAQVTVKNLWNDGSLKFAIIAGTLSLTANVASTITLTGGSFSSGTALTTADLKATGVSATVDCGAFGAVTWATNSTDWDVPLITWVSGHRMSSWIYRKPVGSDAHLVVWMEVRLYAGGMVEVLPWIENGYCDVPNPSSRNAVYTFTLGGTQRFSQSVYLYARTRTPLVSGTILSHWFGGTAPDLLVEHDVEYMQATELVPSYSVNVAPSNAEITALPTTFTPLQRGSYDSSLAAGGFHRHVCMLPNWDALHLVSTSTVTYKAVIFNAYSAGRYNFYFRDEATNRVPDITDAKFAQRNIPGLSSNPFPSATEEPAEPWSIDHQPACGYLAYLLTGSYYHLETVQFLTATNFFEIAWPVRQSGLGIFGAGTTLSPSVRTCAWGVRGLVLGMSASPDSSTHQAAFGVHLKNNIDFYWNKYVNTPSNPQGFIWSPSSYGDRGYYENIHSQPDPAHTTTTVARIQVPPSVIQGIGSATFVGHYLYNGGETEYRLINQVDVIDGTTLDIHVSTPFSVPPTGETGVYPICDIQPPWMHHYMTGVWGWMKSLSLNLDATTDARRELFWQYVAGGVVGLMGGTGSTEYLYRDCASYGLSMGPVSQGSGFLGPNYVTGAGPWHSDFGALYTAMFKTNGSTNLSGYAAPYALQPKVEGPMRLIGFGVGDSLTHECQFANLMRAAAYAVRHQTPNAVQNFNRVRTSANYFAFPLNMENEGFPQGALTYHALPRWRRGMVVNEWREIPNSSISSCLATATATTVSGTVANGGLSARLDAWVGLSIDTRSSVVWSAANGGHGDYFGNEVLKFDLMADSPSWVQVLQGSSGPVIHDPSDIPDTTDPRYARYTDGKPCSRHSYYGQQFIERQNRAVTLGGSMAAIGAFFENTEAFDTINLTWDAAGTYPFAIGGFNGGWTGAQSWSVVKDPSTEKIYTLSYPNFRVMTPTGTSGATISVLGTLPAELNNGALGAMAVDLRRSRILYLHGNQTDGKTPYLYDINLNTWTPTSHPASAAKTAMDALQQSCGLVYNPTTDKYYLRGGGAGATVYVIDGSTLAVSTLTTTGGSSVPASAPKNGEEGVYTRWLYVPELRGIVYFPNGTNNAWFLRTH